MMENCPPVAFQNEAALEEWLTRPRPGLVEFIRSVRSPLIILGAGGKMGPTLAILAKRAAQLAKHELEVIAVSRFSNSESRRSLETQGVQTITADLFNRSVVSKLPDTANLIYLVGIKFGTQQNPSRTWATNTVVPAMIMERYARSCVVALSTGNVYPPAPAKSCGAAENSPLTPAGEYANSAVARERIFEFFSQKNGTPVAMLRLNYAVELRYGILVDIARRVYLGQPIDLANGWFNCIWQGDANEFILRALPLASSPPSAWNLTSPERLSVREVADHFGRLFGKPPVLTGHESESALLSNTEKLCAVLGSPPTPAAQMIAWIAAWIARGGSSLNKPTHFETTDGRY